jgi:hypothetical protein
VKITTPGIYRDFPTAAYFGDPTPIPSFTQSLAKVLIEQSPLHAYQAHPRLNVKPADEDDGGEKYDKAKAIGNAAHKLMLNRGKEMSVGDFEDWRSGPAKAFKLASLNEGNEPILRKHFNVAGEMVDAAIEQLSRIHGCENAFTNGDAEVVIANDEDGIWLRSMLDWITPTCARSGITRRRHVGLALRHRPHDGVRWLAHPGRDARADPRRDRPQRAPAAAASTTSRRRTRHPTR